MGHYIQPRYECTKKLIWGGLTIVESVVT